MAIPAKVADRITTALKRFQPILLSAKSRDINEHDTVVIVVDMLAELFGFDKYTEVTREYCIRGTFCDLALKIDGKLELLLEVKAIGLDLKDPHVKQALDYAANEGVEWVALTNGLVWKVYRVTFGKPIDKELVLDLDFAALNPKSASTIESLYLLTRESMLKSALKGYHDQAQATSRYVIGAILLSDPSLEVIRRELRRIAPDVKLGIDEIRERLEQEVLKREIVEGPDADSAVKRVAKASGVQLRIRRERRSDGGGEVAFSEEGIPTSTSTVLRNAAS